MRKNFFFKSNEKKNIHEFNVHEYFLFVHLLQIKRGTQEETIYETKSSFDYYSVVGVIYFSSAYVPSKSKKKASTLKIFQIASLFTSNRSDVVQISYAMCCHCNCCCLFR